ncbi:MAG TPA: hypothetical protein DCW46_06700 [Desulfotomaculum sp.]|nr:hypothetical protein [Desulfotomaculum sp.]
MCGFGVFMGDFSDSLTKKNRDPLASTSNGASANGLQTVSKAIPTPSGKQKWQHSTVKSILTNEKYKGDAILQKRFTVDFLTKKMKVNEGEVPQYYVENSHPAIIPPETFELAQEEFRRRKAGGHYTSGINCFASRIVCGDCGSFYGRKVWHSGSQYACTVWQCNRKFNKRTSKNSALLLI